MAHDPQHTGDGGTTSRTGGGPPGSTRITAAPRTDRVVFGVTAILTVAFVVWGAIATDTLESVSTNLLDGLMHNGGWAFVLAASAFVVFALWLAISRYGRITLGDDGEKPEFRTVSWVAMMFSAGMGIGLMFYGVTEPLSHFTSPPPGTDPSTPSEAMETAMATTLFHWTLHPWAIYAVVGLAIAYSTYRKRRRQTISAVFTPLIGQKNADGVPGRVIDILAIFATLFGSAASLGLGALQIGSGLGELNWVTKAGTGLLVTVIVVLTAAFIVSAISGIERGVQYLSNINMVLALLLAVFVFVAGPTIFVLDFVPTSIATYFGELPQLAGRTDATGGQDVADWLSSWTVFYWAWWISWTPFVGMFIARISRGRTVRQFIGGVILVPSTVSLIWFAIFGGSAMKLQEAGRMPEGASTEGQLFGLLQQYPIATVTSVVVMVLVGIFFVSGADAASIVMGTLSQRGAREPSRWVVAFWGSVTGAVAAVMLLIGGGEGDALTGLQNLTILVAAPFVIVMIGMCVALMRDLRHDPLIVREEIGSELIEAAIIEGHTRYDGEYAFRVGPGAGPEHEGDPIAPEPLEPGEDPHAEPGPDRQEPQKTA
ncbi:BCCT family transporter [Streptomyces sp. NPDC060194]|uniref:BCCT family transporter n=1 Tax=Streptomyces sp. NPDC060194 TaxID=3347069 RepID=UPI00364E25DE